MPYIYFKRNNKKSIPTYEIQFQSWLEQFKALNHIKPMVNHTKLDLIQGSRAPSYYNQHSTKLTHRIRKYIRMSELS